MNLLKVSIICGLRAYLVIPHTLQWKDGHIKIIRNPSAEPLSPSKTISYEALNMIKGEIQTELLTSLYGETFVTRLNVALFVINIADHLLKSKNDKELFDESQINPKLIYEKAVIEAKKLIINDLAQKNVKWRSKCRVIRIFFK
jgi:hypothetical protein